jgi:hypothetical protein
MKWNQKLNSGGESALCSAMSVCALLRDAMRLHPATIAGLAMAPLAFASLTGTPLASVLAGLHLRPTSSGDAATQLHSAVMHHGTCQLVSCCNSRGLCTPGCRAACVAEPLMSGPVAELLDRRQLSLDQTTANLLLP